MTSFVPMCRYHDRDDSKGHWCGSKNYRFATREEAEASLAHIRASREDLLETRIDEVPWQAIWKWNFEHSMPQSLQYRNRNPDDANSNKKRRYRDPP